MRKLFDLHEAEFLEFDRVVGDRRLSNRPDLCAFMLLDRLCPGTGDIIGDAQHEVIYLSITAEKLRKKLTYEDVLTLVRCGVMYDDETESLSMFT